MNSWDQSLELLKSIERSNDLEKANPINIFKWLLGLVTKKGTKLPKPSRKGAVLPDPKTGLAEVIKKPKLRVIPGGKGKVWYKDWRETYDKQKAIVMARQKRRDAKYKLAGKPPREWPPYPKYEPSKQYNIDWGEATLSDPKTGKVVGKMPAGMRNLLADPDIARRRDAMRIVKDPPKTTAE